jgi:hypothetical protein
VRLVTAHAFLGFACVRNGGIKGYSRMLQIITSGKIKLLYYNKGFDSENKSDVLGVSDDAM